MHDILSLADRIVAGVRAAEQRAPYHFERAAFETVGGAMTWVRDWHDDAGNLTWRSSQIGDDDRAYIARHWLWLRWCFRAEIAERERRGAS